MTTQALEWCAVAATVLQGGDLMLFDWSAVNTALILAAIAYLWRQARIVDQVRQALLGIPGDNESGALAEIRVLKERTQTLTVALSALQVSVEHLTRALDQRLSRPDQS